MSTPPPASSEVPPKKPKSGGCALKILLGLIFVAAYIVFQVPDVQEAITGKKRPRPTRTPESEAASKARSQQRSQSQQDVSFAGANKLIQSHGGDIAYGDTPEHRKLATLYSLEMKEARDLLFTESSSMARDMSTTDFLTYCKLSGETYVFLVHVPELRKFTGSAKKTIVDLAWNKANFVLNSRIRNPDAQIAVGVRGLALYDTVLIGKLDDEGAPLSGIKTRDDSADCKDLLLPYFEKLPSQAPAPAATTEPSPDAVDQLNEGAASPPSP